MTTLKLSQKALRLTQRSSYPRAYQAAFVATVEKFIPMRFSDWAYSIGYWTTETVDVWAARRNLPATYREKKRALYGSNDPLVKSGYLRARVYATTNVRVQGDLLSLSIGKLRAGPHAAPPPRQAVLLFSRLFPAEVAYLRQRIDQEVPYYIEHGETLHHTAVQLPVGFAQGEIARLSSFVQQRKLQAALRLERWRQTPGGSAPIASFGAASDRERQRTYYLRHRATILLRKKLRYRSSRVQL